MKPVLVLSDGGVLETQSLQDACNCKLTFEVKVQLRVPMLLQCGTSVGILSFKRSWVGATLLTDVDSNPS